MRKKLYLLFLILTVGIKASTQSSLNYTMSNITTGTLTTDNSGNTINMGTAANLVPNGSRNFVSQLQPIGFDFIFMGRYYSHFVVNTNGNIGLGVSTSPFTMLSNNADNDLTRTTVYPPIANNTAPVLAAFWDEMPVPLGSGPTVRSVMTGTAPNRCRIIEWHTNIKLVDATSTVSGVFQARLYEGSGKIEYVYGNMSILTGSLNVNASIGFTSGTNDNQFVALQDLTSFTTTTIASQEPATQSLVNSNVAGPIAGLNSTADGQRRALAFTPPALLGSGITLLQITQVGATNLALSWNDLYSNELGYQVLVSTDNINFLSAATLAPNSTYYTVGGLTLGTTYFIKVVAFTEGACAASNTVSSATNCYFNGVYSIGPGGNYTTLTKAIDSIKVKGLAGNVIFELQNNYTSAGEVFPITFPKNAQVPCLVSNKVIIRPAAGATNLMIDGALQAPLLQLDSSNFVIIDGRPGGTGSTSQLTIANHNNAPVLRLNNSSNNSFRYIKISGGTTVTGLPVSDWIVSIEGSAGVGSDNNKFSFCDFFGENQFSVAKKIILNATATSGFSNDNDSLINCNFYDFRTSAINLVDYNNGWVIQSNSFYNSGSTNYNYDINTAFLKIDATFTTTMHQVTQNYFGGSAPLCQGDVLAVSYNQSFYCIDIKGKANVSGNIFRRMRFSNLSAYSNSVVNLVMIRDNFASEPNNVEHNQFGWTDDVSDSLHFSHDFIPGQQGPVETEFACLAMTGKGLVSNNQFGNIRCYAPYNHVWFKVLNASSDCNIRNNTIGNPSIPDNIISHSNWLAFGIYLTGNSATVIGNTISRITVTGNEEFAKLTGLVVAVQFVDSIAYNSIFHLKNGGGGGYHGQTLMGMRISPGTSSGLSNLVEGNNVYSLMQDLTSGGEVTGITADLNMDVRKNFVHNLYNKSGSIIGINMSNDHGRLENNMVSLGTDSLGNSLSEAGTVIIGVNGADYMRHNSIYINGSNVANGSSGSICFRSTVNPSFVHNNIFFNARSNATPSGIFPHACVSVNISYIADNNLYYFNGIGGAIGIRSTNIYTTLPAWQAASTVDANSLFIDPNFIAPGGDSHSVNLHVNQTSPTDGAGGSANTVTVDFDNQVRTTLSPVDIGADAFSAAPLISSFTPASGASGATITITGTNFTGASAVSFGGTAATSFTVVNATTITAIVSTGASGSISVTTPGGTATKTGFTFIAAPTITSFTPTSATAGTSVTISGTDLMGATAVSFGGTAATSFTVVNATTITAVVGTGTSGSVSVSTPGGSTSKPGFVFIGAPAITSFTPISSVSGATVTITGTNLTDATAVSFGGIAASSFSVVNATTITAIVGTGASGLVSVTTPGGTATLAGFTYIPSPTIISFTPTSGANGATVTITGTNLSGATAVNFGGIAASSFTVVNSTTITAVVGTGANGSVSVTTAGGTATLPGFTFIANATIISFSPASGNTGTIITITGTNFTGATTVSFGGVAASSFIVVNATTITAIVGVGASGNIVVTAPGGTASLGGFVYNVVTAVSNPNINSPELTVSPNPGERIIIIKYPLVVKATNLALVDLQGRTIRKIALARNTKQIELDISAWPAGIYHIIWNDGKKVLVRVFEK